MLNVLSLSLLKESRNINMPFVRKQCLGRGNSAITALALSLPVLASFPFCDITEEDLTSNPQLCGLLATLTQHLDRTGLTVPLKTELDKVTSDIPGQIV